MRRVVALVALLPFAAGADPEFPARHDIPAAGLDTRATPDASAAVVGRIDAGPVEVVGHDASATWAQVGRGEGTVWVPLSALTRLDGPRADGLPMRCYGTEPFWGLHLPAPFLAEFERPEHPEMPLQITGTDERIASTGRTRLWSFAGETATATLLLRNEMCSDGMSDRVFALSAAFTLIERTGQVRLHLGCCALTNP